MFDRCTDRARRVMGLSRQEAQRFHHDYIGTEHILLGIVIEGTGVACGVLTNLDLNLKTTLESVEKRIVPGTATATMGQIPFTPHARTALELAYDEASDLGQNYIGTEHMLLGLIREKNGVAAQVLKHHGLEFREVRAAVMNILAADDETPASPD